MDNYHRTINTTFQRIVLSGDFVVLDTETTGFHGQIVQIAIIDPQQTLLDTLVKPSVSIPADATAVHGITNQMVASAPSWADVRERVRDAVRNRPVIIYNAPFDLEMLGNSDADNGLVPEHWLGLTSYHCAMRAYSWFRGEWNRFKNDWRWHRLTDACAQMGVPVPEAPAHSALGDCLRTLALVKAMGADPKFNK